MISLNYDSNAEGTKHVNCRPNATSALFLSTLTLVGACNSLRVDPDDPSSGSNGSDSLISSIGGVDPAFDGTWVAIDFFDLVGIAEQGRPMTCLYAFEIVDTRLVSFYACNESLSVGTPDFSTDWLEEPVTITDNLDDGFDALFEVVDPETSQVLGGEFEMDALETETERFDLIGENAAGFLKLTTRE